MGAILPWLVSQLGKSGAVKAGEEAPPVPHRRAGENHEASGRAVTFTLSK
jgi:hypothetical protein